MILTTKRLVLRDFEEEDWSAMLAYQSDPRYLRYYDWTQRTEQDAHAFVWTLIVRRGEEPQTKFQLAITLVPGGQLIGNGGIRMKTPDAREPCYLFTSMLLSSTMTSSFIKGLPIS